MGYTEEEEKELNDELKTYQRKFSRIINGDKWDSVAEKISEIELQTITLIMNAKSHKDVTWLVMYNAENTLKSVREKYNKCKG